MRKIGVDTNIFLDVIREEPDADNSQKLLDMIRKEKFSGVTSIITLNEIMTLFKRANKVKKADAAVYYIGRISNIEIMDVTREIALEAAIYRAKYRTPKNEWLALGDSIQLATATTRNAESFITRDPDFKNVNVIKIQTPEDLI